MMTSTCFRVALGLVLIAAGAAAQPRATRKLALVHANVVDVEQGRILADQTVLTADGRIVSVGPSRATRLPADADVVNLAGRYVIPGLWDMHVHRRASEEAEVRYFRSLFLAAGVTGVRDMGGELIALQNADASAEREGIPHPRAVATGRKLGGGPVLPGAPFPLAGIEDVRRSARMLRAAGAGHLKLFPGASPDLFRQALSVCRTESLPCTAHVPLGMSIAEASSLGLRSLEHMFGLPEESSRLGLVRIDRWRAQIEQPTLLQRVLFKLHLLRRPPEVLDTVLATYDSVAAARLFQGMASAGTWVTPTLTLHEMMMPASPPDSAGRNPALLLKPLPGGLLDPGRPAGSSRLALAARDVHHRLIRAMRTAGVDILAGTDAPLHAVPGISLQGELVLLQEAGLTPLEALRAATLEPARYFRATDSLGTVAAGKLADLVVLRADPLRDVRAAREVDMVVTRGRLLRRPQLDSLLVAARLALEEMKVVRGRAASTGDTPDR
jgi:imidazolonepropionase-like amidohydrolase